MTGATSNRVAGRHPSKPDGGRTLPASRDTTPTLDLIGELDALAEMAAQAKREITAGYALNGQSALTRIQQRASDVARHAREDQS